MIEILVVMGIIAILAAITIPVISGGGGIMGRAELPRTAELIHSKLQAAQIYANTYRVDTAVVYALDNWLAPPQSNLPVASPLVDSIYPFNRRAIVAAAVMYKLPAAAGAEVEDKFVPVPTENGNFETFPGEHIIMLQDPGNGDPSSTLYPYDASRYMPYDPLVPTKPYLLGMSEVVAIVGDPTILTEKSIDDAGLGQINVPGDLARYVQQNSADFPAHVFSRVGKLSVEKPFAMVPNAAIDINYLEYQQYSSRERYIIHAAPSPNAPADERDFNPNPSSQASPDWITQPIEIFKSTGQSRVARL